MPAHRTWDIFCRVIDNHGDVGVTWRLAADLATRGHTVRLWLDDPSALDWMAPHARPGSAHRAPGVQVLRWTPAACAAVQPHDVVIEAFGCELDDVFKSAMAGRARPPVWINLEYLSAEDYVSRSHGLLSPQASGPAAGLAKWFFYPGFGPGTGGLIREPGLADRQAGFDGTAWLRDAGFATGAHECPVSLFCYEPAALPALLRGLAQPQPDGRRVHLLVTAGRAASAVQAALSGGGPPGLRISWLPLLTQTDFDHLLWSCELNFVRGEDSLVRAIWAGRPLVWQLYPQADGAHGAKLEAFVQTAARIAGGCPPDWAMLMRAWNGLPGQLPSPLAFGTWQPTAIALRQALAESDDLTTRLVAFVTEKS